MNATRPYWWSGNIGTGNGLVPSGNKQLPKPMLTQISGVIRPQWVKLHVPTKFMLRGFVLMVVVVFQKVRPSPDKFVKPAAPGPAEKGSLIFPSQQKSPQKQEGNPS